MTLEPSKEWSHPDVLAWVVCCPACGADNIDREGLDHEAVTVIEDSDEYGGVLGTRGGRTVTEMVCGNGHRIELISANHKGQEVVGLHVTGGVTE